MLSLADKLDSYCCHHTGKEWPNLPVCENQQPKTSRTEEGEKEQLGAGGVKKEREEERKKPKR